MPRPSSNPAVSAVMLIVFLVATVEAAAVRVAADGAAPTTAPSTRPTTGPATGPAGARKVTLDEFDRMREQAGTVVLDVRTPQEFAAGHVPGAVNLPVTGAGSDGFAEKIKLLDKDKTYLVHCARGSRSAIAVSKMEKAGIKNLNDFAGGMDAWRKAKKPIEGGEPKGE